MALRVDAFKMVLYKLSSRVTEKEIKKHILQRFLIKQKTNNQQSHYRPHIQASTFILISLCVLLIKIVGGEQLERKNNSAYNNVTLASLQLWCDTGLCTLACHTVNAIPPTLPSPWTFPARQDKHGRTATWQQRSHLSSLKSDGDADLSEFSS